ncbi:non-canonical purine NTP pyrophosphatase [Candidatus Woesearchaeota archaeon]|nr:non-canonical purine NTP pyrophosphatase [Candidatus Woesearchaeota archaeon]
MKLLIATGNQGKFNEISALLSDLPLELVSLQDVEVDESQLEENGETYAENALIKAQYFAQRTGLTTLADDSGIVVEALKNELGVKTRRWGAGAQASDEEWIAHFLKRMENKNNRQAKFVCHICVVDKEGNCLTTAEGETEGHLTRQLMTPIKPGIPLSSCFIIENHTKVHSALTTEEKNATSHRGKAVKQIKEFLSNSSL